MAASSTIEYDDGSSPHYQGQRIHRLIIDWTSAADGSVTIVTDRIAGQLLKVITDPGSAAPTDNYDITIKDEYLADVLAGINSTGDIGGTGGTAPTLANRHTTNTQVTHLWAEDSATNPLPGTQPYVCDKLTIAVTNAGDGKTGQIIIYYRT